MYQMGHESGKTAADQITKSDFKETHKTPFRSMRILQKFNFVKRRKKRSWNNSLTAICAKRL